MQLNLLPKTTCLETPYFYSRGSVFHDTFYCTIITDYLWWSRNDFHWDVLLWEETQWHLIEGDSDPPLCILHCIHWYFVPVCSTVKPVLTDHCYERPPVLKDHILVAEGPTFQCNWTCHQRPPVLKDHIFMANWAVFQDRFYCTCHPLSHQ